MSLYRSLLAFSLIGTLWGSPKGEKVAAGKAAFDRSREGKLSVSQQSDRAVINWESFSIQAGEVTQFIQPNSSSAVLNRVVGPLRSEIFGTLKSNGRVVLLNPNGVLIGESGVIQTGGFLASTLDVSDEAFMQGGKLAFAGDSPHGVVNLGVIEAADISLIAKIINNEGSVRATKVERQGGRIFLCAEKGVVCNDGTLTGDTVVVTGERVEVVGKSVIDAGGGEIYVGGSFQGKDPEIPNAALTYIGPDAQLLNNGVEKGGRTVIWSEEATAFYGTLSATGIDGGFAEVSSKGKLDCRGHIDLAANGGKMGELLLDPTDINVQAAGAAPYANVSTFAAGGALEVVSPATLNAVAGPVTLQATHNIAFLSPVTLATPLASLTAQAGNDITSTAGSKIITHGGDVTLLAGPFSGAPAPVATGSINLADDIDPTDLTTFFTGSVTLKAYDISFIGGVLIENGTYTVTANHDISLFGSPTANILNNYVGIGNMVVYAHNNIFLGAGFEFQGPAPAGLQMDIQADSDHDGVGDLTIQGSLNAQIIIASFSGGNAFFGGHNINFLGANPAAVLGGVSIANTGTTPNNVELQAAQDIVFQGFGGGDESDIQISAGDLLRVRAGRDITLQGGSADTFSGIFLGADGLVEVFAGRDINLLGGTGATPTSSCPAAIIGTAPVGVFDRTVTIRSGRNINLTAGPNGPTANPNGSVRIFGRGTTTTTIYAQGNIIATNGATGGTVFIDTFPIVLPGLIFASTDIRAGGDITLCQDILPVTDHSIYIQADGSFPLWPAQSGPYLTGTPLAAAASVTANGLGGYKADTGTLGSGIALTTDTGNLSLYSSNLFTDGSPVNLTVDATTTVNATSLSSTSGNISIARFQNMDIVNSISTTGSILGAVMNDMTIEAAGSVAAGDKVTLIVDEQNPTGVGGGQFINLNNTSGVTTTGTAQDIAIYAASGPQPPTGSPAVTTLITFGNLTTLTTWDSALTPLGLATKYNTSYEDGGPVHGGGFGTSYVAGNGVFGSNVVWYKAFMPLPLSFATPAILNLTNVERMPPDTDYTMALFREEFGMYSRQAKSGSRRIFGRRSKIDQNINVLGGNQDYFTQIIVDGQRIRLMDAKLQYPFAKEEEEIK